MNGRIYDPLAGRFLSPDPTVQFPNNAQNFNRYSYVLNNPLSYMDPSGYFLSGLKKFFKKFWRPILAIVLAVVTAGVAAMFLLGPGTTFMGALGTMFSGGLSFAQGIIVGAVGGFFGGFVATGSLKGALIGAFTGAAAGAIGGVFKMDAVGKFFGGFTEMARATAHGISGGISSELGGGKFGQGFLSSFTASLAYHSTPIGEMEYGVSRVMATAVVGGTASVIGGGKFENGAVTSAFQTIFNGEMSNLARKGQRTAVIYDSSDDDEGLFRNTAERTAGENGLVVPATSYEAGAKVVYEDSLNNGKFQRIIYLDHGNSNRGPQFANDLEFATSNSELIEYLQGALKPSGVVYLAGCNAGNCVHSQSLANAVDRAVIAPKTKFTLWEWTNPNTDIKFGKSLFKQIKLDEWKRFGPGD